jgi:hypothetical protein
MPDRDDTPAPYPDQLRRHLDDAHRGLLRVHKALIDHEKLRYERARGRISGPGQFLQLVIHDPWFAWLRPISELAVQIDEFTVSKEPTDPRDGVALLEQARALLAPAEIGNPFQQEYHRSLQESPEVTEAHAEWKLFLNRADRERADG